MKIQKIKTMRIIAIVSAIAGIVITALFNELYYKKIIPDSTILQIICITAWAIMLLSMLCIVISILLELVPVKRRGTNE